MRLRIAVALEMQQRCFSFKVLRLGEGHCQNRSFSLVSARTHPCYRTSYIWDISQNRGAPCLPLNRIESPSRNLAKGYPFFGKRECEVGNNIFFWIYVFLYICVYVYMCICVYVHMCICTVNVYMRLCICVYVYMCICVYVFMCLCVYVFLCFCVYVYKYECARKL